MKPSLIKFELASTNYICLHDILYLSEQQIGGAPTMSAPAKSVELQGF